MPVFSVRSLDVRCGQLMRAWCGVGLCGSAEGGAWLRDNACVARRAQASTGCEAREGRRALPCVGSGEVEERGGARWRGSLSALASVASADCTGGASRSADASAPSSAAAVHVGRTWMYFRIWAISEVCFLASDYDSVTRLAPFCKQVRRCIHRLWTGLVRSCEVSARVTSGA